MDKTAEEILAESLETVEDAAQVDTGQADDTSATETLEIEELAAAPVSEAMARPTEMFRTFTNQPIAVLGEETTDNRILDTEGTFSSATCPQALQWSERNEGGHMGSVTCGVIEKQKRDGNKILSSGYLLNTHEGEKAANLLAHGVASPSADLGRAEWHYTDEKGKKLETNEAIMEHLEKGGSMRRKITQGHIVGATLVPFPAIGSATIKLDPERSPRDVGLVASAQETFTPKVYPHQHVEDPKLTGPTPLTMSSDGRIYGHLAVFGQCHRSVQSECVMVPRSPSQYSHFHTSPPIRLDNGQRVSVGRLTVGTGHADARLRPAPAAAHYDDTGSCFALVRVGEDAFGVWVSGVAAPWATTEQIEAGLGSPLSGDWRNFGKGLDLIAALSVNTPGFAVQGAEDDEGHPVALVASVGPVRNPRAQALTLDDIRQAVREAMVEMSTEPAPELSTAETPIEELSEPSVDEAPVEPQAVEAEVANGAAVSKSAAEIVTAAEIEAGKSPNEQAEELLERAGV